MKKIILKSFSIIFCISMIILSAGCKEEESKEKQPKNIKIICEDTVLPMVKDLVRDYNLNNEPIVNVESAEREEAFKKLYDDKVDILIGYVQPNNEEIEAEVLAHDGIGIVVNTANKVDTIGTTEVRKIYTGDIVNWEALKGEAGTIVPIAFKNVLNTVQEEFNRRIMDTPVKEEMTNSVQRVSSMEEMKNLIAQNKNAIGIMPGQWYNKESKFLKLNGIELTTSNLKNQLYLLRFPIKMYYSKEKEEGFKDLFQYFKSEDGKKIIRKYGIEAS